MRTLIDIFKRSELSRKFKGQPFSHDLCAVAVFQVEVEVDEALAADPEALIATILPQAREVAGTGTFRCGIFEVQTDFGVFTTADGNRMDLDRPDQIVFTDWETETEAPITRWFPKHLTVAK